MVGKKTKLSTSVTYEEYDNMIDFLSKRQQSISEYALMSIAVLLDDDCLVFEKRDRKVRKGPKKTVTVKCSDYLYSAVSEVALNKGVSKAEIVSEAIKDALGA